MTVGAVFTNWQTHLPAPDPMFKRCSPNLLSISDELGKRWGCTDLGCYGWRPIRLGTAPSSHGFGAAIDRRYDVAGRVVALSEILPWLIDNSLELHISAIHDYFGCRIWHGGRGWKTQPVNPGNGMGQSWATYFHIETTHAGWADGSPVWHPERGVASPTPVPIPTPGGSFVHTTIKAGAIGPDVYALQVVLRKVAGNTNIVCDGEFGAQTTEGVKMFQAWYGLGADGVVGPKTWAKIDQVVNA